MIGFFLDEGPISRCYLELTKRKDFKFNEIIYLGKKTLFPKNLYINYKYNLINRKPLIFLKDKNIGKLIRDVEEYFNLGNNFFRDAYSYYDISNRCQNFYFSKSSNINSRENIKILQETKSLRFLNSGKVILKEILDQNKEFLHIHPAYLPEIKGADGSLWNIVKKKNFAGSFFILDKKIDNGNIIFRDSFKLKKFKYLDSKYIVNLYDIWFSFVDPAIRCNILEKVIINKHLNDKPIINSIGGEYFTFMSKEDRTEILKEMLYKS